MQSLAVEVTDNEKIAVGNELDKLFAVHDRPLPTGKKAVLVQELVNTGFPIKAISAGIRKLMHEELRTIRLWDLLAAAREFLSVEQQVTQCESCNGGGIVLAYDDSKYRFALACICGNGGRQAGLVRWTGGETQLSRGRMLVIETGFAVA